MKSLLPTLLSLGFITILAATLSAQPGTDNGSHRWKLNTEDTVLQLIVHNDAILITSLKAKGDNWNWIKAPSSVPLPTLAGATGNYGKWQFLSAVSENIDGTKLVLHFVCKQPSMELTSVWHARPGPGPVENVSVVLNTGLQPLTFAPTHTAALNIVSRVAATAHRAEKTAVGEGKVHATSLAAGAHISTGTADIPLLQIQDGEKHGLYFGFEWELGGFELQAQADPRMLSISANPVAEILTRAPGEKLDIPSNYYGAYRGDIDDGANRFKKWFWNHKITRSLHDNAGEPWVEVCMQEIGGTGATSVTGNTLQSVYNQLAATGAECVKLDFWDGTGKCWYTNRDWMYHPENWPNGFDYAEKAHRAGLKASLYMGGTYNDSNLTTIAARDAELQAVASRFDKGWFDMWRTDLYTAPSEPMPQTYDGVANFLYIQDQLIGSRPNYRYENCCNGGKYKGFAICRRMTFCTMNDIDNTAWKTRTTYYSNSFAINPVQLKSDLGPASTAYDLRTDMLGSILTWAADNPTYKQHIALYKHRQRPILRGCNVYHIMPMPDGVNWDGLQFYNSEIDKGSVFVFKPSVKATDGDTRVIKLKGLQRRTSYALAFQDRTSLNCVMSGAQLMDTGITVSGMTGDNASEIIWISRPKAKP